MTNGKQERSEDSGTSSNGAPRTVLGDGQDTNINSPHQDSQSEFDRMARIEETSQSQRDQAQQGGDLDETADFSSGHVTQTIADRYRLLEPIGEGGMGTVWVAEQTQPVRRKVAIKLIKEGMDSKSILARFEAERQALAMMDHPNIAKVLDAGTTPQGRPYFVMELVRGVAITDYCDQKRLSTKERLELFIKVCQAIQHAHQKGIIHRDIKPSNILVALHDDVSVPKVIDFGIAKATEGRLTESTVYTHMYQFIGTPAYMSPEQAEMSGIDIDTRSDVYSLGVLLYELLTGNTPFDQETLRDIGFDELRRLIREVDPPRPSARISTIDGGQRSPVFTEHSGDVRKFSRYLRGDLDWIVMKALEKDRNRRYSTANDLALDLTRHLSNEPVLARPPSAAYKFRKAWRRNRVIYSAGTCVTVALIVGMAVSLWQASVATKARRQADIAMRAALNDQALAIAERKRADDLASEALVQRDESRQLLYAADMKLAQLALASDNLGRAASLLERHLPIFEEQQPSFEWRYLWQQAQGEGQIASFRFQNTPISCMVFSPDDRWLAIGMNNELLILDADTRERSRTLPAKGIQQELLFSNDGRFLFSGGPDGLILWDTQSWQPAHHYDGMTRPAAMSPDGNTIVCNSASGIRVIDAQSGNVIHAMDDLESSDVWGGLARTIDFSADGNKVVALVKTGSQSNELEIRIWETQELLLAGQNAGFLRVTGVELASIKELTLSHNGDLLAGSGLLGELITWTTADGKQLAKLDRGTTGVVTQLAFSQEENLLIGSSFDQMVHSWRIEEDQLVEVWHLRGHRDSISTVASSHDARMIASADRSGNVILWKHPSDTTSGQPDVLYVSHAPGLFNHLQFLPDNRTLVANDFSNESLAVWDVAAGKEIQSFENMRWRASARVSPDSRWVTIARDDGSVDIIDMETRRTVTTLRGHSNEVRRILFTPDSRHLITATVTQFDGEGRDFGSDNVLHYWELPSGQLLASHTYSTKLNGLTLSPDGEAIAAALDDATTQVIRLPGFEEIWSDRDEENLRQAASTVPMAFSPDGEILVTAVAKRQMFRVYRVADGELLFTSGLLDSYPLGLAFSADGQSIAAGGIAATVKFWNVATGQETIEIPVPGAVYEIAFSDDNQIVAVGTYLLNARNPEPNQKIYEGRPLEIGVHLFRSPSWADIQAKTSLPLKAENDSGNKL